MRVFAIRDEDEQAQKDLAYLLYYEMEKLFFIELPDDADPWETPLLLSSFAKRGERTVNSYWSRLWVQQRIVPLDRQNLGQVLKANGLEEYDEYSLLMLADGRCAQDSYYLVPIEESNMPDSFAERYQKKVEDVVPLDRQNVLVFFRDGIVKKCDIKAISKGKAAYKPILNNENLFSMVAILSGGYGICWGENLTIADSALYDAGIAVPLKKDDFKRFIEYRVVNTAEAAEILGCSRQNINDLIRRGKLHPVKTSGKNTLFLKNEIMQRMWQ